MYRVFYHKGCNDGYFAAAAIALHSVGLNAVYSPVHHDAIKTAESFKDVVGENDGIKELLFIDIAPSPELTIHLIEAGYKVYVVDHHKTARKEMLRLQTHPVVSNPNLKIFIYNELSGAALGYVFSTAAVNKGYNNIFEFLDSIPIRPVKTESSNFINCSLTEILGNSAFTLEALNPLYKLICVRDLWIDKDPDVKRLADALNAYLYFNKVYTGTFAGLPDELIKGIQAPKNATELPMTAINEGLNILNVYTQQARDDIRHAKEIKYRYQNKDFIVYLGSFLHTSLTGQMISDQNPSASTMLVAIKVDYNNPHIVSLSFRSNGINCRKIAERMGGGGHDLASGAIVKLNDIDTTADLVNFVELFIKDSMEKGLI